MHGQLDDLQYVLQINNVKTGNDPSGNHRMIPARNSLASPTMLLSPRYSQQLEIPQQPRTRRNSCTAILNEAQRVRSPPTSSSSGNSGFYGHRLSCSIERAQFFQKFSDPLIQRPYFEYQDDHSPIVQSPRSPHSPHFHHHNHSSSGGGFGGSNTSRHTRHHRSSLTGGASGRDSPTSTTATAATTTSTTTSGTSSSNQRASQAADMFTETGDFGITLAEQLQLTSYQIQLLQQSWQRLRCSSNFFINVFRAVISNNALAKELFQKASIIEGFTSYKCCDVKEHAKSLMELIDFTVQEIHSSTKVVQDRCMGLGAAHCCASERSMSSSWDQFGDSLAEAITKADSIRGKRECLKAWNALLSFIVDSMKGGYLAESKRRTSKKTSRQEGVSGASAYMATAAAAAATTTTATEPTYH